MYKHNYVTQNNWVILVNTMTRTNSFAQTLFLSSSFSDFSEYNEYNAKWISSMLDMEN